MSAKRRRGEGAGSDSSVTQFLDTSVVLASLDPDEPHHEACDRLISTGGHAVYVHALAETFSVLTGGRQGRRLAASVAAKLIEASVLPFATVQSLTGDEVLLALTECESRGVRGGAVYDYLHLVAARKAGAETLLTLDVRDFQARSARGSSHPIAVMGAGHRRGPCACHRFRQSQGACRSHGWQI